MLAKMTPHHPHHPMRRMINHKNFINIMVILILPKIKQTPFYIKTPPATASKTPNFGIPLSISVNKNVEVSGTNINYKSV